MADWYSLPDGTNLGRVLPEPFDGDAIQIRPLARLEYVNGVNPHIPDNAEAGDDFPPEAARVIVRMAVVDWRGKDFDPNVNDASKDALDPETFSFSLRTALELSLRARGEGNASSAKSPTAGRRKNS